MSISGKWVIVAIAVVSVGLALFSVWHRWESGRKSLEFWGVERAELIQGAESVELHRLTPSEDGALAKDSIQLRERSYQLGPPRNIQRAPGVLHLQVYLIEDRSFDWRATPPADIAWRYLVKLRDPRRELALAFSDDGQWMMDAADGRIVSSARVAPFIVDVLGRGESWDEQAGQPK